MFTYRCTYTDQPVELDIAIDMALKVGHATHTHTHTHTHTRARARAREQGHALMEARKDSNHTRHVKRSLCSSSRAWWVVAKDSCCMHGWHGPVCALMCMCLQAWWLQHSMDVEALETSLRNFAPARELTPDDLLSFLKQVPCMLYTYICLYAVSNPTQRTLHGRVGQGYLVTHMQKRRG